MLRADRIRHSLPIIDNTIYGKLVPSMNSSNSDVTGVTILVDEVDVSFYNKTRYEPLTDIFDFNDLDIDRLFSMYGSKTSNTPIDVIHWTVDAANGIADTLHSYWNNAIVMLVRP